MSKKFKQQDYARYKKLADRWRKPKGMQGKMRVKKSGSGPMPKIGYGTKKIERVIIPTIRNMKDIDFKAIKGSALIAANVGARNTLSIAQKAMQSGIKILNMKKVKRAEQITNAIKAKKDSVKTVSAEIEKKEADTAKTPAAKEDG